MASAAKIDRKKIEADLFNKETEWHESLYIDPMPPPIGGGGWHTYTRKELPTAEYRAWIHILENGKLGETHEHLFIYNYKRESEKIRPTVQWQS